MRVELLRGAEADLLESFIRLEELQLGLGDRFYRCRDRFLGAQLGYPEEIVGDVGDFGNNARLCGFFL